MSPSLRRLAPLTGIPFAILLVVTFVTPSSPDTHDTGEQVISHYNDHHSAHLIGDICGAVAVVFFLFFISALRSFFKDKEGADGLSMAAFAGGILIAVGGAVFTSLDVALVDARHDGPWELPVLGDVAPPPAVLIRPDGHVAWAGDPTDPELPRALATWFGPATPAR